jgi:hypothetical protein
VFESKAAVIFGISKAEANHRSFFLGFVAFPISLVLEEIADRLGTGSQQFGRLRGVVACLFQGSFDDAFSGI